MTTSMDDPRRGYPARPLMDECSAAVLDEAVFNLTALRSPMLVGDAGAELHALVSLAAQISAESLKSLPTPGTNWSRGQ